MNLKKGLFFKILPICILLPALFIAYSPVLSGQDERDTKNWRRLEWVDENGKVHTTILSPRSNETPSHNETESASPAHRDYLPVIISAKVVEILSSDTVLLEDNRKLRYVGLHGPEKNDPYYDSAIAYHKKLVEGKFVNILFDAKPRDNDGTLLGFVFINRMTFVNAELIRHGHARAKPQPPNTKYEVLFQNLENRAQSRKLGIWKK